MCTSTAAEPSLTVLLAFFPTVLSLGMHLMQAVKSDEPADSQPKAAKAETDALEPTEAKAADAVESAKAADPAELAKASHPHQDVCSPCDDETRHEHLTTAQTSQQMRQCVVLSA